MEYTGDDAIFRERGFGQRMGFGVRPAVLVVDLIKAFTDPARPLGADVRAQIEATDKLLKAARTRRIPVILATVIYEDPGMADAGIWARKMAGAATVTADTDGWHFDDRLTVDPSDLVLRKKYASCFFGTDLSSRLTARQCDTLLITGVTTSGCVRATVVDSVQHGFRPIIIEEAVGDRSAAAHGRSLLDMDAKYGDVVRLADAIEYLNGIAA